MTQDTPAFFTLDHGTASISASLVAPVDGRYRLLASASAPHGIDTEAILEDLVWRVARIDAAVVGPLTAWRDWSRLEVRSLRPARACLVAASAATGRRLERAFTGAGWEIGARFFELRPDLIALGEACLDPETDAVVVGGRDDADEDERESCRHLWPLTGSLARMRDDVALIACGPFADRPEAIPDDRLFSLPAPAPVPATATSPLREAARQVGEHLATGSGVVATDARAALRASVASLAVLLGNRVEGIEVGSSAGSRSLANPDHEIRHADMADGAVLPAPLLVDEGTAEPILRWSPLATDPAGQLDQLRELRHDPWLSSDRDAARLRLAALRAALERMSRIWEAGVEGRSEDETSDVIVLGGGAFSALPSAAAALAVVDGIRRPGAATILHDHASILAPLGALPVEGDRRRLLADLMDDCLLPLGSALHTGVLEGGGEGAGDMTVTSALGSHELRLGAGELRLVDLPPGIVARLDIDPEHGAILGVRGQRLTLEVSGGLAGLLVDTRDIPLDLPASGEDRRALLTSWERSVWAGGDR